jgi:hypothetical protein
MSATGAEQFSIPFLAGLGSGEGGVNRRRKQARLMTRAALFALFLLMLGLTQVVLYIATGPDNYRQGWGTSLFFFIVIALCATGASAGYLCRALAVRGWNEDSYEWLSGSACKELADLCDAHPALGRYRDQVCGLERRFTACEFVAMKEWANNVHTRETQAEGCRRLYKISSMERSMQSGQIFTLPFESEAVIEQQYARRKRIEARTPFVAFFILGTAAFFLVWLLSGLSRDFYDVMGNVFLSALIALVLTFVLTVEESFDRSSEQYAWLPVEDCASLGSLCEENPGLQPYRDQVREAGRRFTQGEADEMRAWVSDEERRMFREAADAKNQEACRKLYGIASSDDGASA